MITRLKINGYKSLKDIELYPTPLTILFGPNASGKSNILDALQLLSKIAAGRNLKEAFDPPHRGKPLEAFSFGSGGLEELVEKDNAKFTLEVDVKLSQNIIDDINNQINEMRMRKVVDDSSQTDQKARKYVNEKYLRYSITVEITPRSGYLRVSDEYLTALTIKGEPKKSREPFLSRKGNKLHLRMEKQAHPTGYDLGLDHALISMPWYMPHYPHMNAMKLELSRWFFYYFEPRERMRAINPVKEVKHIGMMGEDLAAFLNTLKIEDEYDFNIVTKTLNMIIPSITGIIVKPNKFGEVELSLTEGQIPIPASIVSEGTLRVLGLLALSGVKDAPSLLGFEEPENGIHPRRIQNIAELLKGLASQETQLFITTHSSVLIDLIPNESLFVCKKENGKTSVDSFKSYGPLIRGTEIDRALTPDDEMPKSFRLLRGDFDA